MRNFIAEIEELQVNRKGSHKQKDGELLAAKKMNSSTGVFIKFFHLSRTAFYLQKMLDKRYLATSSLRMVCERLYIMQ